MFFQNKEKKKIKEELKKYKNQGFDEWQMNQICEDLEKGLFDL